MDVEGAGADEGDVVGVERARHARDRARDANAFTFSATTFLPSACGTISSSRTALSMSPNGERTSRTSAEHDEHDDEVEQEILRVLLDLQAEERGRGMPRSPPGPPVTSLRLR